MKNTAIWILKKIYNIDVDNLNKQNIRLAEEKASYLSKNEILERESNIFSKKVEHLEEEKKNLKKKNIKLLDEISTNKNEYEISQKIVDKLNHNIILEQEKIEILKLQLEEKDNEIKKTQSRIQQLERAEKDEDLAVDNEQVKDQIENLNRQYQNLKERYDQIYKDNAIYRAKINVKDSTIDFLNKELIELRNENTSLKKQVIYTSTEEEEEEEENNNNKVSESENTLNSSTSIDTYSEENNHIEEEEKKDETIDVDLDTKITKEPRLNTYTDSSIDETERTIDTVIDVETDSEINSNEFFSQPESVIFQVRSELEKAIYLKKPKYVCKYCHQMVKISGRKRERGVANFFSHLKDSNEVSPR
ncbi:MAG: hypothetical protein ACRCZY_00855 [Phocaeicola sp.]